MSQSSPRPKRIARWAATILTAAAIALAPLTAATASTTEPEADGFVVVAAGQTDATSRTPGTLQTGDDLALQLVFDNPGSSVSATARVEIGDALSDRSHVAAWLGGEAEAGNLRLLADAAAPALAAATSTNWEMHVPASVLVAPTESTETPDGDVGATGEIQSADPKTLAPGVYPLRVSLFDEAGESLRVTQTTLVISDLTSQKPFATVVVPVLASSEQSGILTANEITAATTGHLGEITTALAGLTPTNPETPAVVLAIDPAIGAAITLRGTAESKAWLATLAQTIAERFALQFADADIASQAAAGLPEPLVPSSLAGFVEGIGSGTEDAPDDPAFFETETLLTVTGATPGVFWPRADAAASELEAIAGFDSNAVSLVASDALTEPVTDAPATVGAAAALIIDSELSRLATSAATDTDEQSRALTLTHLAALLAASVPMSETQEAQLVPPHALIALDRDAHPHAAALRAVLETITATTQPAPLATLRTLPQTAVNTTAEPNEELAGAVNTVFAQAPALETLAQTLQLPELLTGTEQARALQTLATGRYAPGDELTAALMAHAEHVQEMLGAVAIDAPPAVQQISRKIDLPVTLRNSLPYAVNVNLVTTPEDIKLSVDPFVSTVVPPHSSTIVKVPIEARVTSAKTSISMQLETPTGSPIGSAAHVPVNVHAQWESVGLITFSALIALLLVIGVIRTIRRKKRTGTDDSVDSERPEAQESDKTAAPAEESDAPA